MIYDDIYKLLADVYVECINGDKVFFPNDDPRSLLIGWIQDSNNKEYHIRVTSVRKISSEDALLRSFLVSSDQRKDIVGFLKKYQKDLEKMFPNIERYAKLKAFW